MDNSVHKEHRIRVRADFLKHGLDHFQDHQALELLLFYIIPRGDTNYIAHNLLNRFVSLSGVLDAPRDLLLEVEGVGIETATFLKVQSAMLKRYLIDVSTQIHIINNSEEAKKYVEYRFVGERIEKVFIICVSANKRILFTDTIASGSIDEVSLVTKDIVRLSLINHASGVILAHNHPSSFCIPSNADLSATKTIYSALFELGISLIDHIIVGCDGICSMKESGRAMYLESNPIGY